MRYPKGSLQLSESRDLPLLREILHSEFVTHSQLFEFMLLRHCEQNRKSFDWRLRRLVNQNLVRRRTMPGYAGEFVYCVSNTTGALLQGRGEYCLVGRGRFNGKEAERSALHAIGLNEIHLSALRAGLVVRWIGSLEVRSQNELTGFGFAKDYDAVVTVKMAADEQRIALEYERTPKPARYYRGVADSLCRETHVNQVLYLVCNYDLLQFISRFFVDCRLRVCFGLVKDWHGRLLDMAVYCDSPTKCLPLRETLNSPGAIVDASPVIM